MILKTKKNEEVNLQGTKSNGTWYNYDLAQEERLIGCYGYLSGNSNIVGLGFIIWIPSN